MSEQVQQNKATAREFLETLARNDAAGAAAFAGPEIIRHRITGTAVLTRESFQAWVEEHPWPSGSALQLDLFGEGDVVFAMTRDTWSGGVMSDVVAYRIENGKVLESWHSGVAHVAWQWVPSDGSGDTEVTREVHRRWYEEMYGHGRYTELAPELCGPVFIRHEADGTFSATAEEHGKRLHESLGGRPVSWQWKAYAEGDKVGIIAGAPHNYVQAWRVSNGKLVESWWVGLAGPGVSWE